MDKITIEYYLNESEYWYIVSDIYLDILETNSAL